MTTKVIVKNGWARNMLLTVEPWADQYVVSAGQVVEVVDVSNEVADTFEVESTADGLVVYGWPGSTLEVFCKNCRVEPRDQNIPFE